MGALHVGDEIGDGEIHLVADAGDDGQAEPGDRARKPLVIECPEILERSAAAHQEQHVDLGSPVREREHGRDLAGRARALDGHRVEEDRGGREAAPEHVQHVPESRAGRRGDDADAARKTGQGALACGVEQSLGGELQLQRLEAPPQLAFAGFLQVIDDELELAARLVQPDARAQQHLQAVARGRANGQVALAEHGAAHLRILVLEREIPVAGRGAGQVRELAGDPQRRQAGLQQCRAPRG